MSPVRVSHLLTGSVNDVSHPQRVRAPVLIAHGIAAGLAETELSLSEDQRSSFERMLFLTHDGIELLTATFHCDNTLQPNSLGSFLGLSRDAAFARQIGPDRAAVFASGRLQVDVKTGLAPEELATVKLAPLELAPIEEVIRIRLSRF